MRILLVLIFLSLSFNAAATENPPVTPQELVLTAFTNEKGDYGFRDQFGNVIIKPRFATVFEDEFDGRMAFVEDKKEGIVAINRKGKILLKPYIYEGEPDATSEGLFRFVEDGKFGFADENGNIVVPAVFDFANAFDNGRAEFCNGCQIVANPNTGHNDITGGKWGLVDKTARIIIQPLYEHDQLYEHYNSRP